MKFGQWIDRVNDALNYHRSGNELRILVSMRHHTDVKELQSSIDAQLAENIIRQTIKDKNWSDMLVHHWKALSNLALNRIVECYAEQALCVQ